MNNEKRSKENGRIGRQPDSGSGDAAQDAGALLSTAEGRAAVVRDMDAAIEKLFAKHRPTPPALVIVGTATVLSKTAEPRELKRFRVVGDSFAAFLICDGHELLVDPLGIPLPGALVVTSPIGGPPSIRRVVQLGADLFLEAPDLSRAPYRDPADNRGALHGVVVSSRANM